MRMTFSCYQTAFLRSHQISFQPVGNKKKPFSSSFYSLLSPFSDEGETFNPLRVDVFLQTLLHLAAKSFSHSFSALGK